VPIGEIDANGRFDLDRKNPNTVDELAHRPPEELLSQLIDHENEIMRALEGLRQELRT
jgi:type I restriction enzyme M protein